MARARHAFRHSTSFDAAASSPCQAWLSASPGPLGCLSADGSLTTGSCGLTPGGKQQQQRQWQRASSSSSRPVQQPQQQPTGAAAAHGGHDVMLLLVQLHEQRARADALQRELAQRDEEVRALAEQLRCRDQEQAQQQRQQQQQALQHGRCPGPLVAATTERSSGGVAPAALPPGAAGPASTAAARQTLPSAQQGAAAAGEQQHHHQRIDATRKALLCMARRAQALSDQLARREQELATSQRRVRALATRLARSEQHGRALQGQLAVAERRAEASGQELSRAERRARALAGQLAHSEGRAGALREEKDEWRGIALGHHKEVARLKELCSGLLGLGGLPLRATESSLSATHYDHEDAGVGGRVEEVARP